MKRRKPRWTSPLRTSYLTGVVLSTLVQTLHFLVHTFTLRAGEMVGRRGDRCGEGEREGQKDGERRGQIGRKVL
jgi:hypothetical protein